MSLNRRRFLEDSLLATAAALAAGPITSVLAEDEKPSKSANEKLGVERYKDVIFSDRLNHASIIDGQRLCRPELVDKKIYGHADG